MTNKKRVQQKPSTSQSELFQQGQNLRSKQISNKDLSGQDLTGISLSGSILLNIVIRKGIIRGADLRSTKIISSKIINTDLRWADISNSYSLSTDFSNSNFGGCRFENSRGKVINFRGAIFLQVIATACQFQKVNFRNSN